MSKTVLFYLLLFSLVFHSKCEDGPIVKTTQGWLQGFYSTTRGGRKIMEFLGIKYAKEPSGDLRFKSPCEPEGWTGVRLATRQCSMCLQPLLPTSAVTGSEDCLCLNIFTPQICPDKLLPVVVFLHGGSYMLFSSDRASYGPELLLDKDVVLVTLNYRLGVLGFLSTEDEVVPGNWAMKDQRAALRWVKNNIAQFGGDPSSVTLMGESAGAASAHLHALSPLSRELFHKAIVHSGSSLVPWAVAEPGELRARTALVAQRVGCPCSPSPALLSCMQSIAAEEIVATTNNFIVWDNDPIVIWNPAIEPSCVQDAFLTQSPRNLNSDIPLLIGFNYAEGGLKTLRVTSGNVEDKFRRWNSDFDHLTALSMLYHDTAPDPCKTTEKIRKFYFASAKQITPEMTTPITQAYGDVWFVNGILDAAEHHRGRTYLYQFNHNNTAHFSLLGALLNNSLYLGTCHFDELPYFFPMRGSYKLVDDGISKKVVQMWTNFITHSEPTPEWKPVSTAALEFLDITNEGIAMKNCPLKERRKFFKTLKLRNETPEETSKILNSLTEWSFVCQV